MHAESVPPRMVTAPTPPAPDAVGHPCYDELDAFYREVWGEYIHHGLSATGRETVGAATEALADSATGAMRYGFVVARKPDGADALGSAL